MLTGYLAGLQLAGLLARLLAGWARWLGWLADWLTSWMAARLTGWPGWERMMPKFNRKVAIRLGSTRKYMLKVLIMKGKC